MEAAPVTGEQPVGAASTQSPDEASGGTGDGAASGTAFGTSHPETNSNYAVAAYAIADAMLAARAAPQASE